MCLHKLLSRMLLKVWKLQKFLFFPRLMSSSLWAQKSKHTRRDQQWRFFSFIESTRHATLQVPDRHIFQYVSNNWRVLFISIFQTVCFGLITEYCFHTYTMLSFEIKPESKNIKKTFYFTILMFPLYFLICRIRISQFVNRLKNSSSELNKW